MFFRLHDRISSGRTPVGWKRKKLIQQCFLPDSSLYNPLESGENETDVNDKRKTGKKYEQYFWY